MQALYKSPVASPQESISKVRLLSKLLIEKEYAKLNMEVKRQYAEWEESITPEALGKTNATLFLLALGMGGCAVVNAFDNRGLWIALSGITAMLWLKGVIEGIPPRQITYEESKRNFYAQFLGLGYSKPFTYTMRQIETIRQYSLDDSEQSKEDIEVLRAMARIRGDKWLMERTYSREIDRDEAVSYDEMNGIADR